MPSNPTTTDRELNDVFADLFKLLAKEVANAVLAGINNAPTEQPIQQNPRTRIDGIRGLSRYLNVAVSTAQRIKDSGTIPVHNTGYKVFFYSDEVDSGLKN